MERVIEINYVDVEIVDDETFDRWRMPCLQGCRRFEIESAVAFR